MFYEYPKIETVFNRDVTGNKKLIVGNYRNPVVEMLADCSIWNCYEKLDGTNIQIFWGGHRLNIYGRSEKSDVTIPVMEYFNSKFNNNETEGLFEQVFGKRLFVLYFEAIGNKIQKFGKHYGDSPRLVLLDVYNVDNDSWWSYGCSSDVLPAQFTINSVAKSLGIECKQLVMKGSLQDIIEYVKTVPLSTFVKEDDELPMEGVVAVPDVELKDSNGNRVIVKIKGCDHLQDSWKSLMKKYQ